MAQPEETAVAIPSAGETAAATDTVITTDTPPTEIPTVETAVSTEIPTASPTPITDDLAIAPDDLFLYPLPDIYTDDRVTIQVLPQVPDDVPVESVTLHIYVDGAEVAVGQLNLGSLASMPQATFEWVWQAGSIADTHEIQVTLDQGDLIQIGDENPDNNTAVITLPVLAAASRPVTERNATWVTAENDCCLIHVVSGTGAYRDLPALTKMVETAVQEAGRQLNLEPEEKLDIFFVDRVIGQGGYAGSGIVMSYLDRQYSGGGLYETLVHEAIHVLDRQIAPQRISLLAEGTAVWAAGGHYKPENLDQRAAALVILGQYVPLADLADDFYPVQHEIGYLEAGGLVKYLIDTYGWSVYQDFYSHVIIEGSKLPSDALNQGFQTYYGKSLSAMESEWLDYLAEEEVGETAVQDLATTIRFYNVMRQYQTHYDPTAHFLAAWLPNPADVIEKGNPADLTGHPQDEINITLETMLFAADIAMRNGDYNRADILLDSVTRVLEGDGAFIDPLAINYLNIVRKAEAEGYEAQQIDLNGSRAELTATKKNSSNLDTFRLRLQGQDWVFTN
ncbi:MAG: hypothetical protein IAF02_09715 [Anaerolineae bacterium]|nr:hypothetical protein [Anaerolineae bacterium]